MNSLLASIQAALRPGAETYSSEEEDITGAAAPLSEAPPSGASNGGSDMTTPNNPGGASTGADLAAAAMVAASVTSSADAAGFKAATDRFAAIMGAEGIKGDGKRMAAALDLAAQSPSMSAEAVIGFVTGNVAATAETAPDGGQSTAYEQQRLSAAGLALPGTATASSPAAQAKAGWGKVSSKINGRLA